MAVLIDYLHSIRSLISFLSVLPLYCIAGLQPQGGVLSKNLGGGVRPASQNPYPIYEQNLRFSLSGYDQNLRFSLTHL